MACLLAAIQVVRGMTDRSRYGLRDLLTEFTREQQLRSGEDRHLMERAAG